jgi:hypothetical protein
MDLNLADKENVRIDNEKVSFKNSFPLSENKVPLQEFSGKCQELDKSSKPFKTPKCKITRKGPQRICETEPLKRNLFFLQIS